MVKEFGLEASEFGENMQDGYQKIDVRQVDKSPLQVAEEYIQNSPRLAPEDAQQVLDHVKTLLVSYIYFRYFNFFVKLQENNTLLIFFRLIKSHPILKSVMLFGKHFLNAPQ